MNDTESLRAELQYIWSNGDYRQVVRKNSVLFSLDSNILHLTSPVHTFVDGLAGVEEVYKTWTLALTLLFLSSSSYCFNPFTYYFFSWLFIWLGLKMLKKKNGVQRSSVLLWLQVISISLDLMGKAESEGKVLWSEVPFQPYGFSVDRGQERLKKMVETIKSSWFVIIRSCTMEGSYIPIR